MSKGWLKSKQLWWSSLGPRREEPPPRQPQYQGRERRYYAMPYGERYIWGATAGMLKNLQFVLTADG